MIEKMAVGPIIARTEGDRFEQYEVRSIHSEGYVKAVHAEDKAEIKILPEEELMDKEWLVRE
jgi:hypothetical protein